MSQFEQPINNKNIYIKIIEGTFRQSLKKEVALGLIQDGDTSVVKREWQVGGKTGESYEKIFPPVFGLITDISFYEGEHDGKKFKTLNITLDENDDGKIPVIGVGVNTKYAQDIMKKLPSIKLEEEVRIRPYSYIPVGQEKNTVGVEITQRDKEGKFTKKCDNYFIKNVFKDGREQWLPTNGYPERNAPWSDQTDEEKEIYKIQVKSFLIKNTETLAAKMKKKDAFDQAFESKTEYPKDEINPDDIPF